MKKRVLFLCTGNSAAVEGDEETKHRAFRTARDELRQRIGLFLLANKLLGGDTARRAR